MRAHCLGKDSGVSCSLHGTGYSPQCSAPQLWSAPGPQDSAKWRLQPVLMRCLGTSPCGDGLHRTWTRGWLNSTQKGSHGPSCRLCYGWSIQLSSWRWTRAPCLTPPALPPSESPAHCGLGPYRLGLASVKSFPLCTTTSCEDGGCWANRKLSVGHCCKRGFRRWREEKLPSAGTIMAQHWCCK